VGGNLFSAGSTIIPGGGGGRIAIAVSTLDTSNLALSASNGVSLAQLVFGATQAGSGTIYLKRPGKDPALLIKGLTPAGEPTPLTTDNLGATAVTLSSLTVVNSSVSVNGISSIAVTSLADFSGQSTLTDLTGLVEFPAGQTTFAPGVKVVVATITAPVGSVLNINAAVMHVSSMTVFGDIVSNSGSMNVVSLTVGDLVLSGASV